MKAMTLVRSADAQERGYGTFAVHSSGGRRARDEAIRRLGIQGLTAAETNALWGVIEAYNEAGRLFRRRPANDNFSPAPIGGGWGSDYFD